MLTNNYENNVFLIFRLDQITAVCTDGNSSETYGGGGGDSHTFSILGVGNGLKIRSGKSIDALKYGTATYGGAGGVYNDNPFDASCTPIGIFGHYSREVDSLGFYYLCP